jgi:hypothetical protein
VQLCAYVEYLRCPPPRRFGVFLAEGDPLLRQALRFLVPRRGYGFVLEQRGDEISQERLSVRRGPAQVAVFHVPARHDGD